MKILITGDFCPIGRNKKAIQEGQFTKLLGGLESTIRDADLAITNLECPLTNAANPIQKSGPAIKSSPDAVNALSFAGFHLVTLANNHILDYGAQGLTDTINVCKEANIDYVGAGNNVEEARRPFCFSKDGKKVAIINIAENEFGNTTGNYPGGNPLNLVDNYYDIKTAKENADFLIVIFHGGREHYQLPSPRIQQLFRYFIDIGADVVVSHHTHCYSGYERYNDKLIFYGLGNFIFDYKKKYQKGLWTEGYALSLHISDDNIQFELIPFYQGRKDNPCLRLLNKSEKTKFYQHIEQLNTIISDEQQLYKAWEEYVKTQRLNYLGLLAISNKYIRELIRRKLLPKWLLKLNAHSIVQLNLLRCETHRDLMITTLENEIYHKN